MNSFWTIWYREYLLQLNYAHQTKRMMTSTVKPGDLILLEEPDQRAIWKMGGVVAVYPGKDGVVRNCKLRMPESKFLIRPIENVYRMEIS